MALSSAGCLEHDPCVAGATRRGTSVLVVDDDPVVRLLVKVTLESAGHELFVVGEAASAEEAVELWRQLRPHVVVLDHRLSGPDGLEVARVMIGEHPGQAVILLSAQQDETLTALASALGVRACLLKSDMADLPAEVLSARRSPLNRLRRRP